MKKNDTKDWMNFFASPLTHGFKKFVYDLIGPQKYVAHEQTIEQLSRIILNERDYENFGKLFAEIFETGFMRSLEEQKEELTKLGLKVNLKTEKKPEGKPIFNQKNPSDSQ